MNESLEIPEAISRRPILVSVSLPWTPQFPNMSGRPMLVSAIEEEWIDDNPAVSWPFDFEVDDDGIAQNYPKGESIVLTEISVKIQNRNLWQHKRVLFQLP